MANVRLNFLELLFICPFFHSSPRIFLNDQKVYFESFKDQNKKQVKIFQDLELEPGVNTITVVARENGSFAHRASATIFSESGDPIMTAKK